MPIPSTSSVTPNSDDTAVKSFRTEFLLAEHHEETNYFAVWNAIKDEIMQECDELQNELISRLLPNDIDIPFYVDFNKCIHILLTIFFKYSLLNNFSNDEITTMRYRIYTLFSILIYKVRVQNENANIDTKIIALIKLAHESNMPYTDVWLENAYALLVKYWLDKIPEKAINIATHAAKLKLTNASTLLMMAYEALIDRFTKNGKLAEAIHTAIRTTQLPNNIAKKILQETFNNYFQRTKITISNIVEAFEFATKAKQLELPAAQNYLNICYENYLQSFSFRKIGAEFINQNFLCLITFCATIAFDAKLDPLVKKQLLIKYYQNYVVYEKLYRDRDKLSEFRNQAIVNTYHFLTINPEDHEAQKILTHLLKNKILFELMPKFDKSISEPWHKELDSPVLDSEALTDMLNRLMSQSKIRTKIQAEWHKDLEFIKQCLQLLATCNEKPASCERAKSAETKSIQKVAIKSVPLQKRSIHSKYRQQKDPTHSTSLFFDKTPLISSASTHAVANDPVINTIYKIALNE